MSALKTYLLLLALGAATPVGAAPASQPSNCVKCHFDNEDENGPAHQVARDVHEQNGLDCADCHGGDRTLGDMDSVRASAGFRGAPDHLAIPQFCARCHSDARYMHDHNPSLPVDQLEKYQTSIHGQRLMQKKDQKVATCVSCHTAHSIGSAKLPYSTTYPQNIPATCGHCHSDSAYMAGYGIPTDQVEKYSRSVHGIALLKQGDLGAPACNDCHGNHGAAPPGVASLDAVCGLCHAIEARLFDGSPHRPAFVEQGLPMCMTCHSNHEILQPSDSLIGLADGQLCATCHADDGSKAAEEILKVSADLRSLTRATDSATVLVNRAGAKGMLITDEEFALKDVAQLGVQARSSIHAFAADSLTAKVKDGIAKADDVSARARNLLWEYDYRRIGLGIASIFITLLALGLYLKIRRIG
ncbi:hypothetical protein C3F09_09830 [candidate division GN15 bacterium]|uniref:Tetrahaem cytochrome domain-containing protein n=1 Tax=candidate division GN15 bacterium TaxID=2072418 RepID=A0A855X1Q9_9BACT|nr:MAG: hypothetical protein C3F09_09830 [candidate division GN15 bacterium]